ncbi:MAG: Fe-S cluster assembly protein HesB [Chlorobiaceae bacterium]
MNAQDINTFRSRILEFYDCNRRVFPWRQTVDRYAVMVSEIMLQQTQAERVVPKFEAWLLRFPDPESLAAAPLRDVLFFWSGLGYNSRALRLQRAAATIVERYGGEVPPDPEELITLPGIGEYTSRSIPVFADNLDIAAIDTNIRRILIHEFALREDISPRELRGVAEEVLPPGRSRDWHNALMDYGSLELTSRRSGIRPLTKQSSFKGSKRWYRGRLIRELIQTDGMFLDEIEARYESCPWNLREIIDDLVQEGLLEKGESYGAVSSAVLRIKGE